MSDRIVGLDHVQMAIPIGGEGIAREFYVTMLGMTEIEKPEVLKKNGGLWLKIGIHQLHLGVMDDFCPATKAHPAIVATEIEGMRRHLERIGVQTKDGEALEGATRFYVSDPFGNRIEFIEWGR